MTNDRPAIPGLGWLLASFGIIAALIAWDLFSDYSEGVESLHVIVELVVLLLATGMFAFIVTLMIRGRRQLRNLRTRLDSARADSRRWRTRYQETIRGLAAAIQEQFEVWRLTKAEAEIALLLLKGLSLKEIAEVRETGERTVREQARSIYRKAGLSGRSELSAFFLEDLFLPNPEVMADSSSHDDH